MPEGTLCNKIPVDTIEQLQAILNDRRGVTYYKEMDQLDVDKKALATAIQNTCKSRIRTWLEICAHCGLCADACSR
jgi:ferredoxin